MEYIFHSRPGEGGRPPMSAAKLTSWYEAMLDRATEVGIASSYCSLQEHVRHLTSVRDFPVFESDFFPDKLPEIIQRTTAAQVQETPRNRLQLHKRSQRNPLFGVHACVRQAKAAESKKKKGPVKLLGRQQSLAIAAQVTPPPQTRQTKQEGPGAHR